MCDVCCCKKSQANSAERVMRELNRLFSVHHNHPLWVDQLTKIQSFLNFVRFTRMPLALVIEKGIPQPMI